MIIKNARILSSGNKTHLQDILIEGNQIKAVQDKIEEPGIEVLDVQGAYVMPGGVDVHVHLREPGFSEKETILTGTKAAAHGGYTSIFAMPNIFPYPDNKEVIKAYQSLIKKDAIVKTYPYATITKAEAGEEVVDMAAIKDLGIKCFSDDGFGIQSEAKMLEAMQEAVLNEVMIVAHTEDMSYRKADSCIHEGKQSKKLGLVGIPSVTEYQQLERDLKLALDTGCKYHICHMSCRESVEALRKYKALGADVSGEVTTHHLLLTELDVINPNFKMNPPLRTETDRQALIEGLLDGTIDFIANDHAPHTEAEKELGMTEAPFGIVALETSIPLIYTNFVKTGIFTLEQFEDFITKKPAQRFGLENIGEIAAGYQADLVIWEDNPGIIKKDKFFSKGKNTPFDGYKIASQIALVLVDGRVVYDIKEEMSCLEN